MQSSKATKGFIVLAFVALASLNGLESVPTGTTTTDKAASIEHTTLGATDFPGHHVTQKHSSASELAKTSSSEKNETEQDQGFNARLVISNSRAKGSDVWGLTQKEAEGICQEMAHKQASLTNIVPQFGSSGNSAADFFRALRERLLNRFASSTSFKSGDLFAVHNKVQLEMLNMMFSRFFPAGTFWTGGKLVKKGGHLALMWLDDSNNTQTGNIHPDAKELLGLDQDDIDKLADDEDYCLALKKAPSHRWSRFQAFRRWARQMSAGMHNTDSTTTTSAPSTTVASTTVQPTVTGKPSIYGLTWVAEKCDTRLPYICLLRYADNKETTASTSTTAKQQETASTTETVGHATDKDSLDSHAQTNKLIPVKGTVTEKLEQNAKQTTVSAEPSSHEGSTLEKAKSAEGFVSSSSRTTNLPTSTTRSL